LPVLPDDAPDIAPPEVIDPPVPQERPPIEEPRERVLQRICCPRQADGPAADRGRPQTSAHASRPPWEGRTETGAHRRHQRDAPETAQGCSRDHNPEERDLQPFGPARAPGAAGRGHGRALARAAEGRLTHRSLPTPLLSAGPSAWRARAALLAAVALGPLATAAAPAVLPAATAHRMPAPPTEMVWLLGHIQARADNRGLPFMVLDKRRAHLWVLDAAGRVAGETPVLLGYAHGDHTVPGIGQRPLEAVRPHEKTTPAGRFGLEPGRNLRGEKVFWLDYEAGLSLHKVIPGEPAERRLQRLASPSARDNRISFGCINVPAAFYDGTVMKIFGRLPPNRAFIYVLPERQTPQAVFDGPPAPRGPAVPAATRA
jgi:hypothetical protein